MAVLAFTSCFVSINSVDMSAYVTSVEIDIEGADLTTTNFGSGGWETRIIGLKGGSVTIGFNDDFASTTVDDRLWALFGTTTAIEVRPTSATVGATNPSYEFSASVNSFQPIAGAVGDLAVQSLTWPITGAVTRATS